MKEAKQTFSLGTAVKITSIINVSGCSSVKLTLYDPGLTKKVEEADMTADTTTAYSYVYQSAITDLPGDYIAHVDATYGAYVGRKEVVFALEQMPSSGATS